jgi:hypothetical protein
MRYTKRRLNDSTAHGYDHQAFDAFNVPEYTK